MGRADTSRLLFTSGIHRLADDDAPLRPTGRTHSMSAPAGVGLLPVARTSASHFYRCTTHCRPPSVMGLGFAPRNRSLRLAMLLSQPARDWRRGRRGCQQRQVLPRQAPSRRPRSRWLRHVGATTDARQRAVGNDPYHAPATELIEEWRCCHPALLSGRNHPHFRRAPLPQERPVPWNCR
jgi:hypothetical protein